VPAIRGLVEVGAIQLPLSDQRDLAEITAPDYPGERLVVCRNPLLAEERARKRGELFDATEKKLDAIAANVRRAKKPLRGTDKIALAVGRVIDHYKMAKHFTITDDALTFTRNAPQIAAEATLDASTCCAPASSPRRSMPRRPSRFTSSSPTLSAPCAASRPSTSRSARVRAHVFLCMLACYVEWHMRQALKPFLFDDDDKADAARTPLSPRPSAPRPPIARPAPSGPPTDRASTASARCLAISPPSAATAWRWSARPTPPSWSIRNSPRCRPARLPIIVTETIL
jgi:hypothetical protein